MNTVLNARSNYSQIFEQLFYICQAFCFFKNHARVADFIFLCTAWLVSRKRWNAVRNSGDRCRQSTVAHKFDAANLKINVAVDAIDDAHPVHLGIPHTRSGVRGLAHRDENCSKTAARSAWAWNRFTCRSNEARVFQETPRRLRGNPAWTEFARSVLRPVQVGGPFPALRNRKAASWS
jgi:hypothetical protein